MVESSKRTQVKKQDILEQRGRERRESGEILSEVSLILRRREQQWWVSGKPREVFVTADKEGTRESEKWRSDLRMSVFGGF